MAVGTWTAAPQFRIDSENPIGATDQGNYNVAIKFTTQYVTTSSPPQVTYVAGTPLALAPFSVTVADIQAYFFTADQGTVANPIVLTFTSNTSKTVAVNLIAGQAIYWDISNFPATNAGAFFPAGIFGGQFATTTYTAFGASIASATINIPIALALPSPGLVNFIGRIAS